VRKLEYIIRRLVLSIGVLFGITIITFMLARVIPSNPGSLYLGPRARPDDIARINQELGVDKPLPQQYITYITDLLHGDWGESIATKRPVLHELQDRVAATLELLFAATLLSIVIGIPLGVISARWQGKALDVSVRTFSIVGVSLPAFWLGLLLQLMFAHTLDILPVAGRVNRTLRFSHPIDAITGFFLIDTLAAGNWIAFKDVLKHLLLPALTLGAYPIGLVARMTRASMLEVLNQDYIRTARAYGIRDRRIIYMYALKNALGPTITVIGLTLAYSLTGAFFVEIIFNWPGLGLFTARSFLNVDYPAIMGMTVFGASGYVLINLLVDLIHAWMDPRISLEQ
jgi:ABC-type dipeptide/oligopeptide/nickel transport system permease component